MSQENIKKWYLDNYKSFEELVGKDSFSKTRSNSKKQFELSCFPTKKDEEWKYTNVAPILKHEFLPSP